jgi:hypothetical protein
LSRRSRWGHGGPYVFFFNHKIVLGPTTQEFDDMDWGSDAANNGGDSFAEAERCPFETLWWSGSDGGISSYIGKILGFNG